MADNDQKTEQPTEKRVSEAMERGQFAKSPEMSVLFMLATMLGVLALTVHSSAREVAAYASRMFTRFAQTTVNLDTMTVELGELLLMSSRVLVPVLIGCVIAAMLAGGFQSGFQLTPKVTGIKFENLDITKGFQRIFSKAVLVRAGIDLLKLIAIGSVLYLGARSLLQDPLFSAPVEAAYLGHFINNAVIVFLSRLVLALGVIAAISYSYEKFKMGRDLMMSRTEVKDERKQAEGSAHAKAAMRRMARRLMQRQMLSAVQTADVVVTNPTHYAVALKYERGKDQAPVVLAKGENRFAHRIKAIAAEHGVPTVENKPVARLLFAMGKVGETIPAQLYQAVAEILAVVYRTHRYYFHRLKSRRIEAVAG